jgi:hypothetical protein
VTLGTSFHRYTRHWRFCLLVALPLVWDLLLCAKDLFVAARTVRHELQGHHVTSATSGDTPRAAHQPVNSSRGADNGADRYGHQPFFGLRYDFGIGRRDLAASKVK